MEISKQKAEELLKRVISEAKASGIPVSRRISTEVCSNARAKKRFAACRKKGRDFYIEINERLLSGEIPEEKIREILAHEVLHTCRGCFDHGEKWKNSKVQRTGAGGTGNKRTCPLYHQM